MAEITVEVKRTPEGLTMTPDPVMVSGDDWVLWEFPSDLAANSQYAMVFFDVRFGPFHSLRYFSNAQINGVIGKGNIGAVDQTPYNYTAMILSLGAVSAVAKGTGTAINMANTKVNTTPDIIVTYDSGNIKVSPNPVGLNLGDTATWYFDGLPAGAFADFRFIQPDPSPVSGPFAAFYACASSGVSAVRASGTNFAMAEGQASVKQFTYVIEVRDKEGNLIAHEEPIIDNLGPPPT